MGGGTPTTYYFQRNLLGDVVAIYDTTGTKVVEYAYDAYGNCTIASTTTNYPLARANPIRYRGYYYDEDTGLYYLNSRYYSPLWRRFISPANISTLNPKAVNGLNLYCYAGNNPIKTGSAKLKAPILSNRTNNPVFGYIDVAGQTLSVIGALYSLSYIFDTISIQLDILSGMADGTLRLFDSNGLGYASLDSYSKALSIFGKGMLVAGSVLSWSSSVYNNFNNPNYSSEEILAASVADAGYYTLKGVGTYYAGQGVAFAASSAGILAAWNSILYLGASYGAAVELGGGVAVVVGLLGAGLLLLIGDLLDDGWSAIKKEIFE